MNIGKPLNSKNLKDYEEVYHSIELAKKAVFFLNKNRGTNITLGDCEWYIRDNHLQEPLFHLQYYIGDKVKNVDLIEEIFYKYERPHDTTIQINPNLDMASKSILRMAHIMFVEATTKYYKDF